MIENTGGVAANGVVQAPQQLGTAVEIALRWGDMDINNHINNVQFARLFEEARVRCFLQWFADEPDRLPVLVVRQDIEFRAPLDYTPDPVVARGWVNHVGNSSFAVTMTLTSPAGIECAVAETRMVAVDETGRPTPLPVEVRKILDAHRGDGPGLTRRS